MTGGNMLVGHDDDDDDHYDDNDDHDNDDHGRQGVGGVCEGVQEKRPSAR